METISIVCLIIFLFIILPGYYLIKVWLQEKNAVNKMPRVPMTLCDKHGAYPSSATLKFNVPADGRQDLVIEQCPQCAYESMQKAKRIPS